MSDNNNDGNKALPLPPQDRESNNGGINTRQFLQDLKRDQEEFYSRISKIAQSEIAASPPYNQQFEKILQNSAKRIAEIDEGLKKLEEEEQHHLIKSRDSGDDNEMVAVRTTREEGEEEQKVIPPAVDEEKKE